MNPSSGTIFWFYRFMLRRPLNINPEAGIFQDQENYRVLFEMTNQEKISKNQDFKEGSQQGPPNVVDVSGSLKARISCQYNPLKRMRKRRYEYKSKH
jgi:hypothetical protein